VAPPARRDSHRWRTARVVAAADYGHLPEVNVAVRNFTRAPAKDVSFEFSAPMEDPNGIILSELPYLKEGLRFLEPESNISRPWGHLRDLALLLRARGLEEGIKVTTRYTDLMGESYATEWTLNPLLFLGSGIETSRGMNDLVGAVEKLLAECSPEARPENEKDGQSREARR
jgi:hypothetical protein